MNTGNDRDEIIPNYRFPILIILLGIYAYFIHYILEGLVLNSRISFDMTRFSSLETYSLLAFSCMALLMMGFILFAVGVFRKFADKYLKFGGIILILILSSFYTAVIINGQNQKKEQETRKLFAQKVDAQQDHIAEYLISDLEEKIIADTVLQNWLSGTIVSDSALNHAKALLN